MKLVTWNCAGGFVKKNKAEALLSLDPDIAIVQECVQRDSSALAEHGYKSLWFGKARRKGMAVFSKPGWTLTPLLRGPETHVVPIDVSGAKNFRLIAIWSIAKGTINYPKVIKQAFELHPDWLESGLIVAAGDFNSHPSLESKVTKDFTKVVSALEQKKTVSAFHTKAGLSQMVDEPPTHLHKGKLKGQFHIDYIFAPASWVGAMSSCEIRNADPWKSLSDHLPVIATFQ